MQILNSRGDDIDDKDLRILAELDRDARAPVSRIAKSTRMSKQVALYHLRKLDEQGILQGTYAEVNTVMLGYQIYMTYLKFARMSERTRQEFVSLTKRTAAIGVTAELHGQWDHCIVIWAQNPIEYQSSYDALMRPYERHVQRKLVIPEVQAHYPRPKPALQNAAPPRIVSTGKRTARINLDDIDRSILTQLCRDARKSLTALAQATKLSVNAVKSRIRRLESERVLLGYRAMIDYGKLGRIHYRVFLFCDAMETARRQQAIITLCGHPDIISVTETMGHDDLEFRAAVRGLEGFYALMQDVSKLLPELKGYESVIYYKIHETLNYFPFETLKAPTRTHATRLRLPS